MNEHHVIELLDHYLDGTLTPEQQRLVESHVLTCSECKREFDRLQLFLKKVDTLSKEIQPSRDLWQGIENRIQQRIQPSILPFEGTENKEVAAKNLQQEIRKGIVDRSYWYFRAAAVMLVFLIGAAIYWYTTLPELPSWKVTALAGTPRTNSQTISDMGKMYIGDLLETDSQSRAKLTVGKIGEVELDPNTQLRLLNTSPVNHRLSLNRGTIRASVSAPPRLFIVETPSATAVDLGCAYTLSVDSAGTSTLNVTTGWVSFEHEGRESVVPTGAMCITKKGFGPGTPFMKQTSDMLQSALYRFDFEKGGTQALDTVLSVAKFTDAVTLWHLLVKINMPEKARVYDKLAMVIPVPQATTRDGVLRGDEEMMQRWRNHLLLTPYAIVPNPQVCVPESAHTP